MSSAIIYYIDFNTNREIRLYIYIKYLSLSSILLIYVQIENNLRLEFTFFDLLRLEFSLLESKSTRVIINHLKNHITICCKTCIG